jgi:hypothetical protein
MKKSIFVKNLITNKIELQKYVQKPEKFYLV